MRVGNRARAEEAFNLTGEGQRYNGVLRRMSGGGCRDVFQDTTDNVVYKVQTNFDDYMRGFGNRTEYSHARTLRRQSDNGWIGRVYIPATSGYSFGSSLVVAMELITGTPPSWGNTDAWSKAHQDALYQLFMLGFGDMHAGNYMWMPGRRIGIAPVDMGSTRYTKDPLSHADTRVIQGTSHSERLQQHREWKWQNAEKRGPEHIAAACPCRCGLVAWYA